MEAIVIKGCPRDKWDEVMAAQRQPFVYISSNGSKWGGEQPDDVDKLLEALEKYTIDPRWGRPISVNPCEGVRNPRYVPGVTPQWIDGRRLFEVEPVYYYFGNFVEYSHCFGIYTNEPETVAKLNAAIEKNLASEAYAKAKKEFDKPGRRW